MIVFPRVAPIECHPIGAHSTGRYPTLGDHQRCDLESTDKCLAQDTWRTRDSDLTSACPAARYCQPPPPSSFRMCSPSWRDQMAGALENHMPSSQALCSQLTSSPAMGPETNYHFLGWVQEILLDTRLGAGFLSSTGHRMTCMFVAHNAALSMTKGPSLQVDASFGMNIIHSNDIAPAPSHPILLLEPLLRCSSR